MKTKLYIIAIFVLDTRSHCYFLEIKRDEEKMI